MKAIPRRQAGPALLVLGEGFYLSMGVSSTRVFSCFFLVWVFLGFPKGFSCFCFFFFGGGGF